MQKRNVQDPVSVNLVKQYSVLVNKEKGRKILAIELVCYLMLWVVVSNVLVSRQVLQILINLSVK